MGDSISALVDLTSKSSKHFNKIIIAGVGVTSQLMSLFKLMFGHPQMLVIKELATEDAFNTGTSKRRLIRSLSSVFNTDDKYQEDEKDEAKEIDLASVLDG